MSDNFDIPEPSKDPVVRARQKRNFYIIAAIVLIVGGWLAWSVLT